MIAVTGVAALRRATDEAAISGWHYPAGSNWVQEVRSRAFTRNPITRHPPGRQQPHGNSCQDFVEAIRARPAATLLDRYSLSGSTTYFK